MAYTLLQAINFARANSQSDANGLTDANGIIWANASLLDIRREFIYNGVDAAQIQEAYRDMTAGQGTYLYPEDMFFLKNIELNYKNTTQQDYLISKQIDISNTENSFDWLRINQDSSEPKFDDRGDWYEVFPTPRATDNLTSAIKLFYYLQPTEYVATTDILTYPDTLDYRILGKRVQAYYERSKENHTLADKLLAESTTDIKRLCQMLSRGEEAPMTTQGISWTGQEF